MKATSRESGALLERAIRRIGKRKEARQLFVQWPTLQQASNRLSRYLSDVLDAEGQTLLDVALHRAVGRATKATGHDQVREFIDGVASIADELSMLQVSLRDQDGDWAIWDFEQPVLDWMKLHRQDCVQISGRDQPFAVGPLRLALLSRVFTIRDLMHTQLEVVT